MVIVMLRHGNETARENAPCRERRPRRSAMMQMDDCPWIEKCRMSHCGKYGASGTTLPTDADVFGADEIMRTAGLIETNDKWMYNKYKEAMPVKKAIGYIALLLVFTLLAVGTTYVLIQRSLGEPLIQPTVDGSKDEVIPEAGIDLNGFYDQNDLVFTEVTEELGEEKTVKYIQIDGLKNADVEAAVNAAIAAQAQALVDYYGAERINYVNCNLCASFSNVLSIGFYAGDVEYNYTNRYLNFNLNDGSLLAVEDLFGVQADLLGLVRSAFYEELAGYNVDAVNWEAPRSPDENELYRTVTGYMGQEDKKFFFTPTEIYFVYGDDCTARVDMAEHAADITVYHKYLSEESLFERDDIGYKNIFTCVHIPEGYDVREFGFAEENFWFDFAYDGVYFPDGTAQEDIDGVTAFGEQKLDEVRSQIEAMRQEAIANPDTMYIFMAEPYVNPITQSDYSDEDGWRVTYFSKAAEYGVHPRIYTMPKELFDSKYRQRMIELYRDSPHYVLMDGMDLIVGDDVQRQRDDNDALYRWDTGELVEIGELFTADYDYDTRIHAYAVYELVQYYGYDEQEAEQETASMWYELAGAGLRLHVPQWSVEQYIWLPLDAIPPSRMTIYE